MPVPTNGLKVISIGMLKPRRDQVVAWRGPILDRALTQLLADVYWGDLDYLILDLPPGTGDVAISLGQKLPNAEVLVVTTPQSAAAEVAERAGTMASMLNQRVIGVVENMSYLAALCPHCGREHRYDVFGQRRWRRSRRNVEHPSRISGATARSDSARPHRAGGRRCRHADRRRRARPARCPGAQLAGGNSRQARSRPPWAATRARSRRRLVRGSSARPTTTGNPRCPALGAPCH